MGWINHKQLAQRGKERESETERACVCVQTRKKQPHIMLNIMKENTFHFEYFGSGLFALAPSGIRCDFTFPIRQAKQPRRIQKYNVFLALQMQRAIFF